MKYVTLSAWMRLIFLVLGLLLCQLASAALAQESAKIEMEKDSGADRKTIRDFVLYNYAHLADDIINGQGMYLETVYSLLEIEKEARENCQKYFGNILIEQKRIPDFSRCISEYANPDPE